MARRRRDISLKSLLLRGGAAAGGRPGHGCPRRWSRLFALLFLALAVAPAASADGLDEVLGESTLGPAERADIRRLFDEAASAGVPSPLLVPRLEEGLAKRVPLARVRRALERELDYLLEARQILQREDAALLQDEASWARTANLLAGGLAPGEVSAVVRVLRRRDFRPGTYLYVALVDWGLPQEQALSLLEALVASALPGEEFPRVVELLALGRRLRIPPEVMIARIRDSIGRVRSVDELERLVLY